MANNQLVLGCQRLHVSGAFAAWCWGGALARQCCRGVGGGALMGDSAATVLGPACWCQKGRDTTINMRWKGGGGVIVTKGGGAVVVDRGGRII